MRTPRDTSYFDSFEQLATAAQRAASAFRGETSIDKKSDAIRACEHEGDTIEQFIIQKLNLHQGPPLKGRTNIRGLVRNVDNIIDYLKKAIKRIQLAGLSTSQFEEQAKLIEEATEKIRETMPCFRAVRDRTNERTIQETNLALIKLEKCGDTLCDKLLEDIECRKRMCRSISEWNNLDREEQVVEILERALDQCEDVGSFMESLKLENS